MSRSSLVTGALARLAVAAAAGTVLHAMAAPPALTLRPVVNGLSQPVEITHAGDSSGRIFVVERGGRIRVVRDGALLEAPFLDIASRVRATGGEQGLLGLAFHPLYAANRRFYVFYTAPVPAPDVNGSLLVVSEFLASPGDPDAADQGSERIVITIPHPGAGNHNGGRIAFGPDGYLYIAAGDGGGSGDQANNGQNKHVLLGKLLRIDVNAEDGYLIPPTNPFVNQDGVDQIWAYGLRNPWKFSFDRATGDLFIADVGQNAWEEVNFEPAGHAGGRNYGWRVMEGNHCFNPSSDCDQSGKVLPIIEYGRSEGFSIIGGYVYRGKKSRALRGYYIFGDLSNRIWAAAASEGWTRTLVANASGSLSTFGEDESGELYAASINRDTLYALDGPGPTVATAADFDGDGRSDALWRNSSTGQNYLYPMNGTTILGGEGYLRTVADLAWQVAGTGDFDGDGRADILWRNSTTGGNYIYLMNGTAIAGEGYVRTVAEQSWQVAGVGDFDGDGKDDILWRNSSTGENYLYLMNGTAIAGEGYFRTVSDLAWEIKGVGDFDGDGKADIFWRNWSSGANYLYPMDGTSIKPAEGFIRTVADTAWEVKGVGDFDGDGRADIIWRHATSGENYLYPMDAAAIKPNEAYLREVSELAWQIVAVGDYDGNGKSDVLWRNQSSGENYLYPMDGTAIKPTEGYIRTVADLQWQVAGRASPALSCQQRLQQLNVSFVAGPAKPGVDDPVTVFPPLNGIAFTLSGNPDPDLYMDCTLALALHRVAAGLVARGIDTVDHLGTYNYRCVAGTGTLPDCVLNEHAYGTAIDFASFSGGGTTYSVLNDWVGGIAVDNTCTTPPANPKDGLLHRVACSWHEARIFNIILTPNYNAAHANHFHVDLTAGSHFIE